MKVVNITCEYESLAFYGIRDGTITAALLTRQINPSARLCFYNGPAVSLLGYMIEREIKGLYRASLYKSLLTANFHSNCPISSLKGMKDTRSTPQCLGFRDETHLVNKVGDFEGFVVYFE